MFKTPGKLRGKTPRTARKRDATAPRQPLTDIFAPNATLPAPASAQKTSFYDKVAQLQVPQDENQVPTHKPVSRGTSPQRAGKPYTDSGYHGMMTEDEMEVDAIIQSEDVYPSSQAGDAQQKVPLRDNQPPAQRTRDGNKDDTGTSDDSFVSAKERESDAPAAADEEMKEAPADEAQAEPQVEEDENMQDENVLPQAEEVQANAAANDDVKASEADQDGDVDMNVEESPQSDASSPQKPLQRKSSFTFSSLPAREPLGAKRSMGPVDRHRSSFFGKSINKASQNDADDELSQEKPAESRAHNKSSAQLLHERLNMLGKTKEPRSSKSIPQSVLTNQPSYPQLPDADQPNFQATEVDDLHDRVAAKASAPVEDDEDDWIAPSKPLTTSQKDTSKENESPARPTMHQKSISTNFIPSPRPEMAPDTRHQKAISISHPNLAEALETTTPAGSPAAKKQNDGPLSASKSRLWSALKSAKSIFASSASASAAAKLEAHNSPAPANSPRRDSGESKMFNMPGAMYTQKDLLQHPARNNSVISFSPSRKTRNSTESNKKHEKELKAQQKADEELEKAREKERQKAAKQQAEEKAKAEKAEKAEAAKLEKERKQAEKQKAPAPAERPISADSEKASESDAPPSKTSVFQSGKLKAPGRLVRPTRNEPAQSKPAPVSIRVASQSQRLGQGPSAQSSFSKSQGPGSAQQPASRDAGPRASSAMGFRPGSAAPANSRVKALEAAARKKEADEKAAAKKAEQKRELERKRAEKAEQEKRAEEERRAAEHQRVQEAKQAAQRRAQEKQAAEARKREQERADQQRREHDRQEQVRREQERIEQQRREAEQWRQQEDARKAREAHELADRIRQERAQQAQAHGRSDVPGTLRQLTKNTVPAINPAKPAKRQLPADDDEPAHQPQRPGLMRGPASYQQADAKRRRTNEEQDEPNERRSVMAPPKRPSTLRKVTASKLSRRDYANVYQETMTKFSHGYTHAPPPAAHHASMFKATVTAQHQMQHGSKPAHPSQLVQMSNARIPFAENSNPPYQSSSSQQMHPGYENAPPNKFKTPARPAHAPKSAKSTPHYPQGDNIELPDIATDSEEESDDEETGGGFRAPSWVASPALRDLLTQQQLVDPETVFGPIGELKMDEVFKNSKNQERLKRFRERGSSALWTETGDAVTSAEKRKDMEMRERVVRDGGWRYEPNA